MISIWNLAFSVSYDSDRNLLFRDFGKQVYTIYCRSTRSGVRVHFHGKGIPEDLQEDRSALTKWILSASNDSILSVAQTSIPEPEPARIRKSIACVFCGESVMESRIQQLHEKPVCIPCYEMQQKVDQNAAAGTGNPGR
jgi:formylmethanofuran dehydrogenase subunit E